MCASSVRATTNNPLVSLSMRCTSPARGTRLSFAIVRQQRVLQRVLAIARARMHHHARRLVDHDDRGVLVHDVERQLLGRDAGLGRQARLDRRGFAADHQVARADAQAVDSHGPLLDPALDARARVLRQQLGQRLVEAPSGEFRGQLEAMGLELGGQPVGPRLVGGRYTSRVRRPFQITDPANSRNGKTFHAINAYRRYPGTLIYVPSALALTGCKTREAPKRPMTDPAVVYERAHQALMQGDYPLAIRIYEALMARYPFAAETRQSRLDVIYAYYRAGESESAIDAADTFISREPDPPAHRLRLVPQGPHRFRAHAELHGALVPRRSEQAPADPGAPLVPAFPTVVEQFPNSEYAHDARRRMVYLRNRLADYEIAVARYYVGRGAYVAAAQRAKVAIEEFDGAPAVREALEIMVYCYDQMELKELAAQTRAMYRTQLRRRSGRAAQGSAEEEVVQTLACDLMGTLPDLLANGDAPQFDATACKRSRRHVVAARSKNGALQLSRSCSRG